MNSTITYQQPARTANLQSIRRRKPRRIAEGNRTRAVIACASCRRLKEKCDGKVPCERCTRHNRQCQQAPSDHRTQPTSRNRAVGNDDERIEHLESIARHFLGDIALDIDRLKPIATHLRNQGNDEARGLRADAVVDGGATTNPLSPSIDAPSYRSFSQQARNYIKSTLHCRNNGSGYIFQDPVKDLLHSKESALPFSIESLPSREVTAFLHHVYFEHAETNHFFAEPSWVVGKFEHMYDRRHDLSMKDAPWICTCLMVLAVGSQFAHMENGTQSAHTGLTHNDECGATEEVVGVNLYQMASKLVSAIITIESVESVQALLLLAHFTLPLDTEGLSYTYLGMALTKCVQLGMHRSYKDDRLATETNHLRTRFWWTAYSLSRRITILHEGPAAITPTQIDLPFWTRLSPEEDDGTNWIRLKERTMIRLTEYLGDFSNLLQMLHRCTRQIRPPYLNRLVQTRDELKIWWASQTPSDQVTMMLSRDTKQLHLSYHLNLVFAGRPFIYDTSQDIQSARVSDNVRIALSELRDDAVYSACEIIKLCALLDKGPGLASASYVEFSACRAAVLALLVQGLREPSSDLREKVILGVRLIRKMTLSVSCAGTGLFIVPGIDAVIRQLGTLSGTQGLDTDTLSSATEHDEFTSSMRWAVHLQGGYDKSATTSRTMPSTAAEKHATAVQDLLPGFDWSRLPVSLFETDHDDPSNPSSINDGWPSNL